MKIALLGYGKMGKLIEQLALEQGDEIVTVLSKTKSSARAKQALAQADVCIDFSQAEGVPQHVEWCIDYQKPLVIGTTGWEEMLPQIKERVQQGKIGCLYAPNFAVGVLLFIQLIKQAGALFNPFVEFDASGLDYHHKHKVDSPSGTAKQIAQQLQSTLTRVPTVSFSSIRCGSQTGSHTIYFDGPDDLITVTHQSRSRRGYAKGALQAASWICGKQGFFTMEDVLCF